MEKKRNIAKIVHRPLGMFVNHLKMKLLDWKVAQLVVARKITDNLKTFVALTQVFPLFLENVLKRTHNFLGFKTF